MARLPRHRLVIMREGYASVMRDPRRNVWGVLWELALADVPALDRYEGVAGGLYAKVQQSVLWGSKPRRALVYVGRNAGPGLPRPSYLEAVLAAAERAGLPDGYRREMDALGPRAGRTGADRGFTAVGPQRWAPTPGGTGVRPTRSSPLQPERDPSAGWSWTP